MFTLDKTLRIPNDLNVKLNLGWGGQEAAEKLSREVPGSFPSNTVPQRGFATVFAVGPIVVRFQASLGKV